MFVQAHFVISAVRGGAPANSGIGFWPGVWAVVPSSGPTRAHHPALSANVVIRGISTRNHEGWGEDHSQNQGPVRTDHLTGLIDRF